MSTSLSAYAELLANMAVKTNYASCNVVADRAKVNGENLKNMQRSKKKGQKFTDPAFSHDKNALFWEGVEKPGVGDLPGPETLARIEWNRISDYYPDATLFGSENIRP